MVLYNVMTRRDGNSIIVLLLKLSVPLFFKVTINVITFRDSKFLEQLKRLWRTLALIPVWTSAVFARGSR